MLLGLGLFDGKLDAGRLEPLHVRFSESCDRRQEAGIHGNLLRVEGHADPCLGKKLRSFKVSRISFEGNAPDDDGLLRGGVLKQSSRSRRDLGHIQPLPLLGRQSSREGSLASAALGWVPALACRETTNTIDQKSSKNASAPFGESSALEE